MKILIVDDSTAMRMIVRRTLRQAGYGAHAIQEAPNGWEALQAVRDATPDLILSDWHMPEMSGLELLEALRHEGNAVHFGFVSCEMSPVMLERARSAGARFVVQKPFTPEGFQKALTPVLGPPE